MGEDEFARILPTLLTHARAKHPSDPAWGPEDLVQEVWLRCRGKLDVCATPRERLAYLRRAIDNLAIDRARRRAVLPIGEVALDTRADHRSTEDQALAALGIAAVLADPDRNARLALARAAGYEDGEIGAAAGLTGQAVKVRIWRWRKATAA